MPASPDIVRRRRPHLWATILRDFGDLPVARQLQIAALAGDGICPSCRDAGVDCYCAAGYDE